VSRVPIWVIEQNTQGVRPLTKCGRASSASSVGGARKSLWFESRQRQSTLLFRPYLRRRPTEWSVGRFDLQIYVRKVLSMAGIQSATEVASLSATPTWSIVGRCRAGSAPTNQGYPLPPHPSPVVKRSPQRADSKAPRGLH